MSGEVYGEQWSRQFDCQSDALRTKMGLPPVNRAPRPPEQTQSLLLQYETGGNISGVITQELEKKD